MRFAFPWLAVAAAAALPSLAEAQVSFRLDVTETAFTNATYAAFAPGDTSRLFFTEKTGAVKVLVGDDSQTTPFLDLTDVVHVSGQTGLVSLLFHPDYATNGYVFAFYSDTGHSIVLERFTVPVPSSYQVDMATRTTLLAIDDVISFHPGGGMDFGPDGALYVGIGDRRQEIAGEGCTAQDGKLLIGKLLRLDEDGNAPSDNPWVADPEIDDRIWGFGLREPFRLSFDDATGDLYVTDVGDQFFEEVTAVRAGAFSPNFGWRVVEGTACANTVECTAIPCDTDDFLPPSFEYSAEGGCFSIIGGEVYRGTEIPELQGQYLFADWCTGRMFAMRTTGGRGTQTEEITDLIDVPGVGLPIPGVENQLQRPVHIGQDASGEVFVLTMGNIPTFGGTTGSLIYRLKRATKLALNADGGEISASLGGQVSFDLDAGPDHAGQLYLLLGSMSGYAPGLSVDGLVLPLNIPDAYFDLTLGAPAISPLTGSLGWLDGAGQASASIQVDPQAGHLGVGQVLHHAGVVLDPALGGQVVFTSNALALGLAP